MLSEGDRSSCAGHNATYPGPIFFNTFQVRKGFLKIHKDLRKAALTFRGSLAKSISDIPQSRVWIARKQPLQRTRIELIRPDEYVRSHSKQRKRRIRFRAVCILLLDLSTGADGSCCRMFQRHDEQTLRENCFLEKTRFELFPHLPHKSCELSLASSHFRDTIWFVEPAK